MSDFRDLFIQSHGKPIDFQGKQVHVSVRRAVAAGDTLAPQVLGVSRATIAGPTIDHEERHPGDCGVNKGRSSCFGLTPCQNRLA